MLSSTGTKHARELARYGASSHCEVYANMISHLFRAPYVCRGDVPPVAFVLKRRLHSNPHRSPLSEEFLYQFLNVNLACVCTALGCAIRDFVYEPVLGEQEAIGMVPVLKKKLLPLGDGLLRRPEESEVLQWFL